VIGSGLKGFDVGIISTALSRFDDFCEQQASLPGFVPKLSLLLFCLSGFAAVGVDIDHVPQYIFGVVIQWFRHTSWALGLAVISTVLISISTGVLLHLLADYLCLGF
jgi:hypothetical protein